MKHILYFLFFLFLVMPSCIRHKSTDYSLADVSIIIDLDSAKRVPLKLGEIRYIPLETSENCLIGNADKVLIRNGKIYVADFSQAMALFVFDLKGKFLSKIARRGQGPGEYISFKDFDINSNGDIYIFDQYGRKLLVLDSEGKYLRMIKSNYYFENFCVIGNRMYWAKFLDGKRFADLGVYDMKNEQLTFLLNNRKFLHDINVDFSTYKFYYSPGNTYYSPKFSEIIYAVNTDGISPAIGIKNLPFPPPDVIEKWEKSDIKKQMELIVLKNNYFLENVYIYENNYFISIGYKIGIRQNMLLYDKRSESAYLVSGEDFFKSVGDRNIMGSTGKDFFSVISFNTDNVYEKRILESRKELKNWKEDDNPVIAIFDLDM